MGQKLCRNRTNQENDINFVGLSPIDISKEIINSSEYYRTLIGLKSMIWKSSKPTMWKNYEYEIISWNQKTTLIIHNLLPFKAITPISNEHTCYICLDDQNVDCKMNCCNHYLHYDCALKLDPINQCCICKKNGAAKINIYHCKSCNQINYSEDLEQEICNYCRSE